MASSYTPKIRERTQFGNPILRTPAKRLSANEVKSKEIQQLIEDMKFTCDKKRYGVGLAAVQVGEAYAISTIQIKKTPTRPNVKPFVRVIINPEILEFIGKPTGMWEGCISFSSVNAPVFAQATRYPKVSVRYMDEHGKVHKEVLDGLPAHVFQHETDHCNGVLFVDKVKDPRTWMNASEYKKMRAAERKKDS